MTSKTNKKVKVTQIRSSAKRQEFQIATLKGLGLNKMNRSKVLEDTPSVRGMINSIQHMLKIEEVA
jgi:large subunit ribosomal protein L30